MKSTKQFAVTGLVAMLTTAIIAMPTHAAATGWNQDAAGTYDYNAPANWVGGTVGDINGIWDSSLTLLGNQTMSFGSDTLLNHGLTLLYDGNFNETYKSDGIADHTVTLGGDILINTVTTRAIYLGSASTNQKLNVDLGGATRTFDVRSISGSARSLTLYNNISNGGLVLQGGGNINLSAGSYVSDMAVSSLKVQNVTLSPNATSDIHVSGALTFDGTGGINVLSISNSSSRNHVISAGSLVNANGAVALIRGSNLGTDVPGTANVSSFTFTTAPALVGGGGAPGGSNTNVSIIPWAFGGTSTSDGGSTFVTYDATNGVRLLDTVNEFAHAITDGAVSTNNVRFSGGGDVATIDSATTINSLFIEASGTATNINGTGTLTVTSGAVFAGSNAKTTIYSNLNFGAAQGVIGYTNGKVAQISGALGGSGGIVFYSHSIGSPSGSLDLRDNAALSTYTGDTYINGRISLWVTGVLPNATDGRSGDVYVNGVLYGRADTAINGLNGNGYFQNNGSGAVTYTIGDGDANGDFGGVIAQFGTVTLNKIGNGTQILGGANTYKGATNITAGKLIVNGSLDPVSAVSVNTGATLGGSGVMGNVTLAANAHIAPGNSPGTLTVAALSLDNASLLDFQLGSLAGPNDLIVATGDLTLDGILNVEDLGGFGPGQYLLISYSGLLTDNTLELGLLPAGFDYSIDTTSTTGSVFLNVAAVPEPATLALLGLGGLMIAGGRSFRGRRA